jgi:hypothetical protein
MLIPWIVWLTIFYYWFSNKKPYKDWTYFKKKTRQDDSYLDSNL